MVLALCGVSWTGVLLARNPETDAKLKGALANFQAVTPEMLRDTANADLLVELRSLAAESDATPAHVLLMKLGDESAIQSCVNRLHSDRKKMAMNQLMLAGNPKIISFLSGEFNMEERGEGTFVGDQLKFPVSMNAAWVVKTIIVNSPAFSVEVREWAKALPELSPALRAAVRAWWETNKAALLREDYTAVVAP